MNIETILRIELEGLCRTIRDYTSDNYIISYTNIMQNIEFPDEKETLSIIVDKLIDWYTENYSIILESKYINNKNEHSKSFELLKSMRILLDITAD